MRGHGVLGLGVVSVGVGVRQRLAAGVGGVLVGDAAAVMGRAGYGGAGAGRGAIRRRLQRRRQFGRVRQRS